MTPKVRHEVRTGQLLGPREIQEDAVEVGSMPAQDDTWIVVADGMGGHPAGEVAAEIVCETVREGANLPNATPESLLRAAHRAVIAAAVGPQRTMGAAAVVVHVTRRFVEVAWLGDCRVSIVHSAGSVRRLTIDHTIQGAREREGKDGAGYNQTMLTGSVGMPLARGEVLPVETATAHLRGRDRLVCTTDGVHDAISTEALGTAARQNVQVILDAVRVSERDNASVVLLRVAQVNGSP